MHRLTPSPIFLSVILATAAAHADIFQWEYINPADPSQGKRQSTTLCPDGAGAYTGLGANLSGRNLTMAYLIGADLRPELEWADAFSYLIATKLNQADLSDANFDGAYLTNADLTGAEIRGASFNRIFSYSYDFLGGLTLAQLYSTASYQAHDLSGVSLVDNNLSGANFAGQNLTDAVLDLADLTGADFTNAEVRGARFTRGLSGDAFYSRLHGGITLAQLYSTASYAAHDLSGIGLGSNDLSGANFSGQNLTGATLGGYPGGNLTGPTGADFTNAEVRGAALYGITFAQLASTATYATHDLSGIGLASADLSGANFSGFNLTGANLNFAMLTDANLNEADFTGASVRGANFNNAGLTLAQLYSTSSFQYGDLGGIGLANTDLSGANFSNKNFSSANLSGADLSQANLTNADLGGATLTGADLAGAEVRGANLADYPQSGITLAQLYSTASYQAHDLSGISLRLNNLAGANFAGQNLTNADFTIATLTDADFTAADVQGANFFLATLTGADFTDAEVRGAHFDRNFDSTTGTGISLAQLYSTASYQAHDLSGISLGKNNLAGANFAGQNLTNADLGYATLTGADFTGSDVRGARFNKLYFEFSNFGTGISLAQLYSTASYAAHDLSGIGLRGNNLAGANFAGQNLANANFDEATLTGADFTAADTRGAAYLSIPASAITTNLIRHDGHINGLVLDGGGLLVVRDYDGNPNNIVYPYNPLPPIPITIDQHLSMALGGTLRMVFEEDAWDSTISFAPGIPVTLGGTLELTFADNVNLTTQLGRTFDLFNWTGVTPTGAFAISSPYAWNLSNLYTTGQATLTAIPEPTTLALVALGLFGLAVGVRRSQQKNNFGSNNFEEIHAETQRRRGPSNDRSSLRPQRLCVSLVSLVVYASAAHADIFQWEYINPADPSQGKQQSTTLCIDGAWADAVPGAYLGGPNHLNNSRNLNMAYLIGADLKGANFGLDEPFGLTGNNPWPVFLIDADLSNANLTDANFEGAELRGADLTGAEIRGASFNVTFDGFGHPSGGLTLAQLYSTASYQVHDLTGIGLGSNDLSGGNFAGQNLTNANFGARYHVFGDLGILLARLIGADFTGADARGAAYLGLSSATTTNLIRPDGHINGLVLNGAGLLVVRDYDGDPARADSWGTWRPTIPPIPITIDQHLAMATSGTLRMVFEADAWDSTFSFAPGIPVMLGGTLELTFADNVNLASQIGRTFDLFNWTGVTPSGAFAVSSPYRWDLSNLYTTGQVTLTAIPEPTTVVLLALASGVCVKRRRPKAFV